MRWTEDEYTDLVRRRRPGDEVNKELAKNRSKYRNTKVRVDGVLWDSQHEADHYRLLKAREAAGEIKDLRWKVAFPLYCPVEGQRETSMTVSTYVADFVYEEHGRQVVCDTKGHLTALYKLKRKWLFLQEGIEILEVFRHA